MPKKIEIIFPETVLENRLKRLKVNLFEIENKINEEKKPKEIFMDFSKIIKLDFFGYQYLYFFYYHLKNMLKKDDTIIYEKSQTFIDFEQRMGLTLDARHE
jgi:hypothetical protein